MATKKSDSTVEALLLRDSCFGAAGEVVTLSAVDAAAGQAQGMLDLNEKAIAAAKE